jgi:hypothetical protein
MFERLATLRSWVPEGVPEVVEGEAALVGVVRLIAEGRLGADSVFAAAWLWREVGGTGVPGLVFWSAPVALVHRASLAGDARVLVCQCISEASLRARRELARLQVAERRLGGILGTKRSRLPDAGEVVLRRCVATAGQLGEAIGISSRAALGLIDRMVAAKVLREATGRRSWRGFVVV